MPTRTVIRRNKKGVTSTSTIIRSGNTTVTRTTRPGGKTRTTTRTRTGTTTQIRYS